MQNTILIVEEGVLFAMDLQLLLEDCGWRVIGPVATVQGALRLLEGELPLVALLDVSLGNELVTPVAEALKMRAVPFAVASAYPKPEQRSEEHTSELQSLMRISSALFCLKKTNQ